MDEDQRSMSVALVAVSIGVLAAFAVAALLLWWLS